MKPFTRPDLMEVGYSADLPLEKMVEFANQRITRGITSRKYILKLLAREYGAPFPLLEMREESLSFSQAIIAKTKEEKANLAHVQSKMHELMRCPKVLAGSIMPDACPSGPRPAEIPVGGGIIVDNAIIPAAHSADICCSMYVSFYEARTDVHTEMNALQQSTRFGPGGHHWDHLIDHEVLHEEVWDNPFLSGLKDRAKIYMADQGDGNHFAYLGKVTFHRSHIRQLNNAGYEEIAQQLLNSDTETKEYRALVTHHGSRGLGSHLYKRGLGAAIKHTKKVAQGIPEAAAWLDYDTPEGSAYWEALQYVSRWTLANHQSIHTKFLHSISATAVSEFGNEHNFVWKRGLQFFHGKGATPAWNDEQGRPLLGLIPLNMAEPILITLGKNNVDYLSFAPHGAGRNLSRTRLKREFHRASPSPKAVEHVLAHSTAGLDIRWYLGQPDISESPLGYKDAQHIRDQIKDFGLANILAEIQPLGTIMAGSRKRNSDYEEEPLTPKQKRQIQHRAERRRIKQNLNW